MMNMFSTSSHGTSRGRCRSRSGYGKRIYQEVHYRDGGGSRQCVDPDSPSGYNQLSGSFDSPGTRRYTIPTTDDDDDIAVHPLSPVYQSAESGLDMMLLLPESSRSSNEAPPQSL